MPSSLLQVARQVCASSAVLPWASGAVGQVRCETEVAGAHLPQFALPPAAAAAGAACIFYLIPRDRAACQAASNRALHHVTEHRAHRVRVAHAAHAREHVAARDHRLQRAPVPRDAIFSRHPPLRTHSGVVHAVGTGVHLHARSLARLGARLAGRSELVQRCGFRCASARVAGCQLPCLVDAAAAGVVHCLLVGRMSGKWRRIHFPHRYVGALIPSELRRLLQAGYAERSRLPQWAQPVAVDACATSEPELILSIATSRTRSAASNDLRPPHPSPKIRDRVCQLVLFSLQCSVSFEVREVVQPAARNHVERIHARIEPAGVGVTPRNRTRTRTRT